MVSGSVGSIAIQQIARLSIKSPTGPKLLPPSSLNQTPPPTLPIQIRSGFLGSIRMERVRPPMLLGPREAHPAGFDGILLESAAAPPRAGLAACIPGISSLPVRRRKARSE